MNKTDAAAWCSGFATGLWFAAFVIATLRLLGVVDVHW